MATVLRTLLDNSITFALLFAAVWLLKRTLRRHLSTGMQYAIWAVVLVGLLIPMKPQTGINLWTLLPSQVTESVTQKVEQLQPHLTTADGSGSAAAPVTQPNTAPKPTSAIAGSRPETSGQTQPAGGHAASSVKLDGFSIWGIVWLAGMAVALLWLTLGGWRLRRQIIRCGNPNTPAWLQACARQCAQKLHLRRRVRIIVQPVLAMPAVTGIFRPILALPESVLLEGDEDCVRHILLHEFIHVKRGDLIVIALLNLLSAIYWFHPLAWLCFRLIRADMETACDSEVIAALGAGRRQDYIHTLVHFSGLSRYPRAQAALSLQDARIQMKRRIEAMFMTKKTKPAIAAPVILLVLGLLLAALVTGCLPNAVRDAIASPSAIPTTNATGTPEPQHSLAPTQQTTASGSQGGSAPAATPTATAKPTPTPTPAVVRWEDQYQPVLDQYRQFAADISKSDGGNLPDWKEPWGQIAADVMLSTRKFGYALRDMDKNGTPELFLMTSDGSIWAMYTLVDGTPTLLGTFWSRNACVLDQSDQIFTVWSNGAMDNGQDAYRIAKDGKKLELVQRVAMESTDESGNPLDAPRYYQCVGAESNKKLISKAEADKALAKFPKDNAKSGLKFLPLGQQSN